MFVTKKPDFKKKVTVDYLCSTWNDHQQIVEEMAMSQMHSLELSIPMFNVLTLLHKPEFNRFMKNLKRTFNDSKVFSVMVAGIMDTVTCMIKHKHFYEHFAYDNTQTLHLLKELLNISLNIVRFDKDFQSRQLVSFIRILENSAERIQDNETINEFKERLNNVIKELKTHLQHLIDKEKKCHVDQETTKDPILDCEQQPRLLIRKDLFSTQSQHEIKENFKMSPAPNNKKVHANIKSHMINTNAVVSNNNRKRELNNYDEIPNKKPNLNNANTATDAMPLKDTINKKNAFTLMMMSSKLLTKKKNSKHS